MTLKEVDTWIKKILKKKECSPNTLRKNINIYLSVPDYVRVQNGLTCRQCWERKKFLKTAVERIDKKWLS